VFLACHPLWLSTIHWLSMVRWLSIIPWGILGIDAS